MKPSNFINYFLKKKANYACYQRKDNMGKSQLIILIVMIYIMLMLLNYPNIIFGVYICNLMKYS